MRLERRSFASRLVRFPLTMWKHFRIFNSAVSLRQRLVVSYRLAVATLRASR